jgi:hypothetical protein
MAGRSVKLFFVFVDELRLILWLFGLAIVLGIVGFVAVIKLIRHDRNQK